MIIYMCIVYAALCTSFAYISKRYFSKKSASLIEEFIKKSMGESSEYSSSRKNRHSKEEVEKCLEEEKLVKEEVISILTDFNHQKYKILNHLHDMCSYIVGTLFGIYIIMQYNLNTLSEETYLFRAANSKHLHSGNVLVHYYWFFIILLSFYLFLDLCKPAGCINKPQPAFLYGRALTIGLLIFTYTYNLFEFGIYIHVLYNISDLVLSISKILNYLKEPIMIKVSSLILVFVWIYLRVLLFGKMLLWIMVGIYTSIDIYQNSWLESIEFFKMNSGGYICNNICHWSVCGDYVCAGNTLNIFILFLCILYIQDLSFVCQLYT